MIPRQNGVISPVILRQFIECPAWQWDPQVAQALRKTAHIRPWLTARCAWPIPFLVGGMLPHELAVLCAPEIAFALEVIDTGRVLTQTILSPGHGIPAGGVCVVPEGQAANVSFT
jgi:hypothetical protein